MSSDEDAARSYVARKSLNWLDEMLLRKALGL